MQTFFENILVMILAVVIPLAGAYLVLVVLGWGLKMKSGTREQQGLTDLWIANQAHTNDPKSDKDPPDNDPPAEP